jgi:hypothetical protein
MAFVSPGKTGAMTHKIVSFPEENVGLFYENAPASLVDGKR